MSNSRDPSRGNVHDRERRRLWLLTQFGNGKTAPCLVQLAPDCLVTVNELTITVDRVIPGRLGGRYVRGNIRPACSPCQNYQGSRIREEVKHATTVAEGQDQNHGVEG